MAITVTPTRLKQTYALVLSLAFLSFVIVCIAWLSPLTKAAAQPSISKSYNKTTINAHGYARLTFTITNDDAQGAWNWSFTDNLPAGMTVADPTGTTTNCSGGSVTATVGGSTVAVAGTFTAGQANCTASVYVTASNPGVYSNCDNNFSGLTNILPPTACADLTCESYNGSNLPDFFIHCDRSEAPTNFNFSIEQSWSTDAITEAYQTPVVGDLYGNGSPVAVIMGNRNANGTSGGINVENRRAQDIHIVNTTNGNVIRTITTPYLIPWSGHAATAIADLDGDGQGEIVVKAWHHANENDTYEGKLVAYKNDGTLLWISDARIDFNTTGSTFLEPHGRAMGSLSIADFNGDGIPEVFVGNRIFNGATGALLASAGINDSAGCPFRNNSTFGCAWNQTVAVDMDDDGKLELVAGNVVYKVNITNTTGTSGNSVTVWQQADAVPYVGDGWTAVADMDQDGNPDVIVVRPRNGSSGTTAIYVWDGQTGQIMGILSSGIGSDGGTPMIGDIDHDGKPEIVIQNGYLRAFDFESGVGLSQKWAISTTDSSAMTSLSMFDFNSDGKQELVYRDESNLRIIDGSGSTAVNLATFPCRSDTATEMPIIADLDGTGEARILVSCGVNNGYNNAALRAFKTAGDPWAPTRPVWNQQAYFATHVNDDLTIPSEQAPNWIAFEDTTSLCGGGITHPMNSFQQQMTQLDPSTGCPVWCAPPMDYGDAPLTYGSDQDTNGARHTVPSYNENTHTAPLMLGTHIDIETNGHPSAAADGDDTHDIDDEDSVSGPIYAYAGQATTVNVFVTNNTTSPATLAGWLDANGNGVFDAGERAPLVTVPANTSASYPVTFPASSLTANSFARFRVFTGNVADPQPLGFVIGGEVEDYPVLAASVHYKKVASPMTSNQLLPGQLFTYTITVENTGHAPLTGLSFTDNLSEVIDDATYQNDVAATIGTATFTSPDQISWTGNLSPGQIATVTYSIIVNGPLSGDGIMLNGVVGSGPGSNCTADPSIDPECFTRVPMPDISVHKTVLGPTNPKPGDIVNYQFTIKNNGAGPATSVAVADTLVGVLDDAMYNNDAASDLGAISYNAGASRLNWFGNLAASGSAGDTATVTYSVTIRPASMLGDKTLLNALISTACPSPALFDVNAPGYDPNCVTTTNITIPPVDPPITPPLPPNTGIGRALWFTPIAALVAILTTGGLVIRKRYSKVIH